MRNLKMVHICREMSEKAIRKQFCVDRNVINIVYILHTKFIFKCLYNQRRELFWSKMIVTLLSNFLSSIFSVSTRVHTRGHEFPKVKVTVSRFKSTLTKEKH